MGSVAATILPRAAVKVALDAQGLYTGATGERLEAALGEWLDKKGYPRTVQQSGPEDLAFVGGASPAGDVLWDVAQQHAARERAGAFGGTAAVWPDEVPAPAAPPHGRRKRRGRSTALRGLGSSLSFEQKAAIGFGIGVLVAISLGAAAGKLVQAADEPTKKTEAAT